MDRTNLTKLALLVTMLLVTLGTAIYAVSRIGSMVSVFRPVRDPPWFVVLVTSPTLYLSLAAVAVAFVAIWQLIHRAIPYGGVCIDREVSPLAFWSCVVVEITAFAFLARAAIMFAVPTLIAR